MKEYKHGNATIRVHGEYDLENGRLTLKTDDGRFVYCFNEVDGKMVFDGEASSEMVWFSGMYDGCVFE